MLWLLLLAWPLVGLAIGLLLGRSITIEEHLADQHAQELPQSSSTDPAGTDPGYALAEQG
jgi:hypothetical protein